MSKFNKYLIKTLSKLETERNFLNLTMAIFEKLTANTIFHDKRLKAFPLRSGAKQGRLLSPLLLTILEVLNSAVRQDKEIHKRHAGRSKTIFTDDACLCRKSDRIYKKLLEIREVNKIAIYRTNI